MPEDYQQPITLRSDVNPWERQVPRETDLMYSRFMVYRDLGPECDRVRQTLEVLNSTGDKLTYLNLKKCSSAFRWSSRAAAWDRYNAAADRARMVKKRRRAIDEQCTAAQKLRQKAVDALSMLNIEDLTTTDIVRFLDLAYKIENSIFAEFGVEPGVSKDGVKAEVHDISSWTPAERRRRLEALRAETNQRTNRAIDDDEVVA